MATDRLGEEPLGRMLIPLLREEKVNRLAALIHGPIEIMPLALGLDVRLIHPPAMPHRAFAAMEGLFEPWGILQDLKEICDRSLSPSMPHACTGVPSPGPTNSWSIR